MYGVGVNTVNKVPIGNVYPTATGEPSLGLEATSMFPRAVTGSPVNTSAPSPAENAANIGATGQPFTWWAALAAVLVALMYFSTKYDDGQYANLKASAYNIFTVTLAAIIGISLFKLLFTKFPVPGLSTVVLSV